MSYLYWPHCSTWNIPSRTRSVSYLYRTQCSTWNIAPGSEPCTRFRTPRLHPKPIICLAPLIQGCAQDSLLHTPLRLFPMFHVEHRFPNRIERSYSPLSKHPKQPPARNYIKFNVPRGTLLWIDPLYPRFLRLPQVLPGTAAPCTNPGADLESSYLCASCFKNTISL